MEIERIIGRLEEQGKNTAISLDHLDVSVQKLDAKVDALLAFKWKIYGATAAIAVIFSGLFQIFIARMSH